MPIARATSAEPLARPWTADLGTAADTVLAHLTAARRDVTSVGLVDDAPARLAVLRAGTGPKLPDCCVLLAAEQTRGAVATFDDRLANAATEHGLAVRTS